MSFQRASELLIVESIGAVVLPWPAERMAELEHYARILFKEPRRRWPGDEVPVVATARAVAFVALRLSGAGVPEATTIPLAVAAACNRKPRSAATLPADRGRGAEPAVIGRDRRLPSHFEKSQA